MNYRVSAVYAEVVDTPQAYETEVEANSPEEAEQKARHQAIVDNGGEPGIDDETYALTDVFVQAIDERLTDDEHNLLLDALESHQQLVENNAEVDDAERERIDSLLVSIERKVKATMRDAEAATPNAANPPHDCMKHAVYVTTDGPIGHGWECGVCRKCLQVG